MVNSWAVYYVDDADGTKEFVESFSDSHDAYAERDRLQAEVDADEDSEGIRVQVFEEMA